MVDLCVDRETTDKRVIPNSGVNTLYLTSACNLACTYCYESLDNKVTQTISDEAIRSNMDIVFDREDNAEQTLFILFGGEPTLVWDKCVLAIEYAKDIKPNTHFSMISNGIKFLDDEFCIDFKKHMSNLSLDISFDVSGNDERIYHSGKSSTDDMYKVFEQLNKHNIEFRMRYTINNTNVNNIVKDLLYMSLKYKPQRLITSIAWTTLSDEDDKTLIKTKEQLRLLWQHNKLEVPVCDMFCDMCNGCDATLELKTYYSKDGEVRVQDNGENVVEFADFKSKTITIGDYVKKAQTNYGSAMEFYNRNLEAIGNLYPNAKFECELNIMTRFQDELTPKQTDDMVTAMRYFLTKETRFNSDSAIVSNFLVDIKEVSPILKQQLEDYLFEDNTRFSFMYVLTDVYKGTDKFEKVKSIYSKITDEDDLIQLHMNIDNYDNIMNSEDGKIIIERFKKECLH